MTKPLLGFVVGTALLVSACERTKPIVVGSKPGAGHLLLAEIVAQHLETRLAGVKVQRRPGTGDTAILFQAINAGEITLYPETTGVIASSILREQPSPDPVVLLERTRGEIARIAQLELIELGFDDGNVVVVPAGGSAGERTLSSAALGESRWKLAVTPQLEQEADFQALHSYHLPLAAPLRSLDSALLFDAMARGELNMVVTTASDGRLTTPDWKVLQDDKKAFSPQQVCLLVRQDRVNSDPRLRPALGELAGKLNLDQMRNLNRQVEVFHVDTATVARDFLASVGLR
jgi:glycine betaine/choline ABC-type transport system substrate-binding protein